MSTIKTTSITHGSNSGTANLVLASDGKVTIPEKKLYCPGAVVQVQSTCKTDGWSESVSAAATSGVITGLTVAITPTASTSKVLIMCHISGTATSSIWQNWSLTRGGSKLDAATGDQWGSNRRRNTVGGLPYTNTGIMNNFFFTFLDSPSSTSAQTYGVVFTNGASGSTTTAYVNQGDASDDTSRGSYTSVITAMEIAGT